MTWKLEELKEKLNKAEKSNKILQWSLVETQMKRKENYLIQEKDSSEVGVGLDQDREIRQSSYRVTVFTPHSDTEKQGRASASFFKQTDLDAQLENLIKASKLSEEQRWSFEEPDRKSKVKTETCYAPFSKDLGGVADAVLEDLNAGIASPDLSQFNSAELFCIFEVQNTMLSSGFESRLERSKIYGEVCFSHKNSHGDSEEFLCSGWNSHPEQFNFQSMSLESAEYAMRSLEVERPESRHYSVLLNKDVLGEILNAATAHFASSSEYYKAPFLSEGSEFIPNFEGEKFEMKLDPSIDYLFGSRAFSTDGRAQKPMTLVSDNSVVASITSSQFSQYLEKSVTSSCGNLVIEAKGLPFDDLIQSESQVLEILQFSGLFVNPMTLTYSSEIRLAKLHDSKTGRVQFLKGGSLSGNLIENLRNVKWSKEKGTSNHMDFGGSHTGYSGPAYALFSNVSISS